ncbi:MAG TPA: methyltransferase domain-containing protein [Reyranella sp.]|nr:methyltransferase domain-containing protein [Reyranella sp.]
MSAAGDIVLEEAVAALRPSEYTGALIQALRAAPHRIAGASVLELGSGSGVVLAALGALGAASLCGVDIEREAVIAGARLLDEVGHGDAAQFHHGDMWQPVKGRRFDLVVANLPHFPMTHGAPGGRWPSWSCGGSDGRRLLDPFLEGLARHLSPQGCAVIAHNAFVGLERSRAILGPHGLGLKVVSTVLVHIPAEKVALMTNDILEAEEGRTLHRYGPYIFADMHIVEIAASEDLG